MPVTTGYIETPNGSKYLQQLCKHFGHKVDVTFDSHSGRADLPVGPAFMTADAAGLTVRIELKAPEAEAAAHNIIDRHLEKFAFRENIRTMTWRAG